jgi:phenylpropionate dioxygenase-like ring-hydroxylating dioxygenase large terminal subunit
VLDKETNELLTRVGEGTPMGELLRRYWQPVALSEELPAGSPPKPLRILGEDLVLFRDDQGRPGLLALHCSHRGADLSYGRIEDGGLRCLYHGWLYDIYGRCLEQPGEPEGGKSRDAVRHPSYPCKEHGDLIFAYMGRGEAPLLPAFENLVAPSSHRFIRKYFQECNFLQANEGNIDPIHLSYLHAQFDEGYWSSRDRHLPIKAAESTSMAMYKQDRVPTIETEVTDFGVRIFATRRVGEGKTYLRVSNFILPNLCAVPGPMGPDGFNMNWHVPIDDGHHWKYMITFRRSRPLDREEHKRSFEADITPDYRLIRNLGNRFQQDREEMKQRTFSGMGPSFVAHDAFATESQGPIEDRTREHLVSSDQAIVAERKLLVKAIRDLQEGREPPLVFRGAASSALPGLVVLSEVVSDNVNVKEYVRELIEQSEISAQASAESQKNGENRLKADR